MLTIGKCLIFSCIAGMFLTAWPILPPQDNQWQVLVDAVQTDQIRALDQRMAKLEEVVSETDNKMQWILGSVAGIYGLMAIIGMFNIKVIKNGK